MKPLVSIITPSFNRANIIDETAQSIFNQTYANWEWVIVDDGSTDNSWNLLGQYARKDDRVKIFQRDREPKGACVCRNIAVEKSIGDYLLFLDTDDLLASFCLEQRVKTIQQYSDIDFVIFPMLMFKKQPDDLKLLWNIDSDVDDIERILLGDPVCQGTGTLWVKDSFIKAGMWNEELLLWQDIELHLRSLLNGLKYVKRFDLVPDVFLRISDISLSRTGYHSLTKWYSRKKVFIDTANKIFECGHHQKYRRALRAMYINIFFNAANSGFFEEVEGLLQIADEWKLFSNKQKAYFKSYVFLRKSKLYKIPYLQNIVTDRMCEPIIVGSLGRVLYEKAIQL